MAISDLQRYPLNLCLIDNAEDNFVFLGLKVLNSDNSFYVILEHKCASHLCREPRIENNLL